MRGKDLPVQGRWTEDLDAFLHQLPRDFRYAVELRNRELLTAAHGAVLARHGVAHVFNSWTEMPTIGEDRKSTRLNSSHGYISYAVFCLKKKKPLSSNSALERSGKS